MVHATPGVDSVSHRTGRLAARIGFRSAGRVLTNVQYVSNLLGGPHVSILGREQIRWLCRRYGLTAIETEYVSSYSFSNRHYAKVVPGLSTLPAPVGAALFGLVRATIKNKLLLIARKQ
jgi:hypothetical protein